LVTTQPEAPATPGAPLPYTEICEDTFSEKAARTFTATEVSRGTLVLRGPCPRCTDAIDIPLVNSIFKSSRAFGWLGGGPPKAAEAASYTEPMMCTCQNDHPNRPDGRSGCGAYWVLTITPPPS
jgi:hypothetical protein